jgi:replicative DNA helicase
VLNLAHNVAVDAKEPVLIFSLEMSKEQLVDRLLSMQSGVDAWALRTGNLTDNDFEKLADAMGVLGESPIYIDDTPGITVATCAPKPAAKPTAAAGPDHRRLPAADERRQPLWRRGQPRTGNSEISRGLKGRRPRAERAVIALSQLSRSVENRSPQIPQLADLRESGSIEQDADIVAFIYREDYYNPETERKNITDILIKKHRNGALRNVELYFDRDKQRFRSLDNTHSRQYRPVLGFWLWRRFL